VSTPFEVVRAVIAHAEHVEDAIARTLRSWHRIELALKSFLEPLAAASVSPGEVPVAGSKLSAVL
jgi:hypothetical protein